MPCCCLLFCCFNILVPRNGSREGTLVLVLNRRACLNEHTLACTCSYTFTQTRALSFTPQGAESLESAAVSFSLTCFLHFTPSIFLLVHFSSAQWSFISVAFFDGNHVAKAYIWPDFSVFLSLLKFKCALLAWLCVQHSQSMLNKVYNGSIIIQSFLSLSLCWLKCVRLCFPPSRYHPLSRWIQREKSVSARVCVGARESKREKSWCYSWLVGEVLAPWRMGKVLLASLEPRHSFMLSSWNTHTQRHIHKLVFVTQEDIAST